MFLKEKALCSINKITRTNNTMIPVLEAALPFWKLPYRFDEVNFKKRLKKKINAALILRNVFKSDVLHFTGCKNILMNGSTLYINTRS